MSQPKQSKAAKTITSVLLAVQGLSSAAVITLATIAAIVGQDLSGNTNLAGIPGSVTQLGAAFSALLWSLMSDRLGRRNGLALGITVGATGAALAGYAVMQSSFGLLLGGLAVMASARASSNLGRFVAAEVNPPHMRGRAVAFVVLGGTIGSVVGPLIVDRSSTAARRLGLEALSGPYFAAAILFLLAAIVMYVFLRPEPKQIALDLVEQYPSEKINKETARPITVLFRQRGVITAMTAMILGYAVMVMLMGMTSLHMRNHAHSLTAISLVFSVHTLGMFAFSVVTGYLIDKWGRRPVIISGALMLIGSCFIAPVSTSFWPLALALFLLGLGWNFCYVGGSTLLSDQLSPAEKAATQGTNDLLIGLTSAAVSALSGVLLGQIGYEGLSMVGAVLSGLLLLIVLAAGKPRSPMLVPAGD